jgi:hypothetical protein
MRIDVEFDGETVISVGGRWDRRLGEFDGEAENVVVIEPHVGQIKTVMWFRDWLGVHAGRRDDPPSIDEAALAALDDHIVNPAEVFSSLLAGGRRAGKTWIAALCCALYAVQFPGAIVWVVNPTDGDHDEVRRYMSHLLEAAWIARETAADGWELINGSAIMLKSAYVGSDPDAIKEGEAHLVWMNEGQKMAERVYVVARGAIVDSSGLVLICANPPVGARDQQWVGDFVAAAVARRRASVYYHFNPLDNPHINRNALLAIKREVDLRTFRIEVLGEFLPPEDAVAYNWIRTEDGNERPVPVEGNGWVDVTSEFLRMIDLGDELTDLIGMDFQVHPHMGGPVYRIYNEEGKPVTRESVVLWGVDEIVIQGDELQWCEEARGRGYEPEPTIIVGDGTGEYQHSRRSSTDSPPPEWHGRGSFDIIRMGGFRNIVRPDPKIRRNNPHVLDRVRALTSLIENAAGRRRYFLDPDRCPQTAKSIREWPTTNGKPSRTHEAAHLGDGASYPIVRLFPRLLRSGKPGGVDPLTARIDRPQSKSAFLGRPPRASRRKVRGL